MGCQFQKCFFRDRSQTTFIVNPLLTRRATVQKNKVTLVAGDQAKIQKHDHGPQPGYHVAGCAGEDCGVSSIVIGDRHFVRLLLQYYKTVTPPGVVHY